ncbi:MAG TPA: allantoate amidohydrolase [Sphingobium sp.]
MDVSSGARAVARCDLLGVAPYSDAPDMLIRAYLTPAHRAALGRLRAWMEEAGMAVRLDPAGNLIGRYEGTKPGAGALLIGSHIDTVRNAGRYDGPLGIMLGIECVAALHAQNRRLPFAIEVIAFGDEEGSRFPAAMLCSRAVSGTLPADVGGVGQDGVPLDAAFADFGLDLSAIRTARRSPDEILGYFEMHIEQGPALEAEGLSVGIVTGIAAQARYEIRVESDGDANALSGACAMVAAVEAIGRGGPPDLVATVGRISVSPDVAHRPARHVVFSIDVRAPASAERDVANAAIERALAEIAEARGLILHCARVHELDASPCAPHLIDVLADALAARGLPGRRLMSGAGHDAMALSALCPTAMLFIRCEGGVSHNPAEAVDADDAEAALQVALEFLSLLAEKQND